MTDMQIGVLGNRDSWYVNDLCRTAQQLGHVAFPMQFPQLRASVNATTQLTFGEVDLRSLDAIIVRTMPPGSLEQVVVRMDVLATAEALQVRVVNSAKSIECAVDKYLTTQRLSLSGIPVPETVVCETADLAMEAFEQLGGDVVVKPLFGAEGRGILRVDHPELALRTFRTLERLNVVLYIQKFIGGKGGDIRILMLGGTVVGAMKRLPAPGDFRANAAQRGTSVTYQPTDALIDLAMRSAAVTGCVFAGVDIMHDAHNQPTVIEVNAVPGWRSLQKTCGIQVAGHFLRWLETTS